LTDAGYAEEGSRGTRLLREGKVGELLRGAGRYSMSLLQVMEEGLEGGLTCVTHLAGRRRGAATSHSLHMDRCLLLRLSIARPRDLLLGISGRMVDCCRRYVVLPGMVEVDHANDGLESPRASSHDVADVRYTGYRLLSFTLIRGQ